MEQQIRFCTTSDGKRIAYATVGEGPPYVWVPGWVSHLEVDWENPDGRAIIEASAQRFTVIRYDKRGTGLSDRDLSDYSIDVRLLDLEAVVADLKLRKFVLRGMSEGGPVAIAYAARHPRQVSRLVLFGTFASGKAMAAKRQDVGEALASLIRAEWNIGSQAIANLIRPGASPEQHEMFARHQREGATPDDAVKMIVALGELDVSPLLPKINVPTIVVHGRQDEAIPFEFGRELAGGIRGARFVPFEGGHVPADQNALAMIRETILEFLAPELSSTEASSTVVASGGPLTILFTDMQSSTALTQQLGDAAAQEVRHAHNDIVRAALSANAGTEIKHTGDGIMASFSTATSALQCGIAIQRGVAAHVEQHPDSPLGVYVGLNAGEPIAEEQDLFGTSVDLARRVCDHAEPGQILASDVVRQLAAGKDFLFADLGETELRGFEDPVKLWELRWQEER